MVVPRLYTAFYLTRTGKTGIRKGKGGVSQPGMACPGAGDTGG